MKGKPSRRELDGRARGHRDGQKSFEVESFTEPLLVALHARGPELHSTIPWAPESAGRCSRSRRISCAPGLAFPACPLRSFFVCFVIVVVVFSEKHDEKPAWEAGATRASLSEKGSRQSLTSSYTRVSLTSSSPSYSLHTHRVLEVPSH